MQEKVKELYDRLTTISALYKKWHSSLTIRHIKEQFYEVFGEDMFKHIN